MIFFKRNFIKYFFVGVLAFAFLGFNYLAYASSEAIDDFYVNISIQKDDGSLLVNEKITYDFGDNQKHGIFRHIPLRSEDRTYLKINVLKVTDQDGKPYPYTVSINDKEIFIKIGDPNILVTGVKTYVISYQVYNAIRTFENNDEIYWNVTGNDWPVVIRKASALINLPDSSISDVKMICFTGLLKSTQKNCVFNKEGDSVLYSTTQALGINEGLTIALSIPKGYIHIMYVPKPEVIIVISFGIILLLFLVMTLGSKLFKIKYKPLIPKELKNEPVVVEYNPPDNLSPIDIGTILNRKVDAPDIFSVIIDLAVRGYIKIRHVVKEIKLLPDEKYFEIIKLKDGSDLTHPADKTIFNFLFSGRESVNLNDLDNKEKTLFQDNIKKMEKDVIQRLFDQGYFDKDKSERNKKWAGFLIIIAAVIYFLVVESPPLLIQEILDFPILGILLKIFLTIGSIVFVIRLAFGHHGLTQKGILAFKKILGFREFLQLTEKDKLQILNAPELQPETFEKFLPYAMVFGVEDKWAAKFEGIYNTTPSWYQDPSLSNFNSVALVNSIALFNSSFIQGTSRSSGFSGGSSGGGSGGGGGGSW
jgi:uncharacterized membrane protein